MDNRKIHLDFIRGMAAIMVLLEHLRSFFFVNYSQVDHLGPIDKIFYFMTGFGHEAVMVFFVLSGYFIGSSVYKSINQRKWSWPEYGLRRMARLWIVLIPALLLTFLLDSSGMLLHGSSGYDGRFNEIINSGPSTNEPANLSPSCLAGNVFFLQTIRCPVYGTNGPIWSLAYEFWYYLLFPLLFLTIVSYYSLKWRIAAGLCFLFLFLFLIEPIRWDGLIWLMGFGAYFCSVNKNLKIIVCNRYLALAAALLSMACLFLMRKLNSNYLDFVLGLTFACMVPYLADQKPRSVFYDKSSEKLSSMSYTLYLVHFPFLAFLFFVFRLPYRSQPTFLEYVLYAFLCFCVLIYAWIVWFLFERRTDEFRLAFKEMFKRWGITF